MSVRILESLDRARAASLGLFLKGRPGLIRFYRDRPRRLAALYLFNVLFSLGLALFFPLWTLFLGPLLLGFPHLLQSFRYAGGSISKSPRFLIGVGVLVSLVITFRLLELFWPDGISFTEAQPSLIENFSVGLVVAWAWFCSHSGGGRWSGRWTLALTTTLAFLVCAWQYPFETVGALILLHNLVAFAFWVRTSAPGSRDRRVAWAAGGMFSVVTLAILSGVFAPFYRWFVPALDLRFVGLDFRSLGRMVVPGSDDMRIWTRAVTAYAFGQSQHYFVWMKALPDVSAPAPTPPSFRESFVRAASGSSARLVWTGIALAIGAIGVSFFLAWPEARAFYFAVASFHGYFEIAALFAGRSPWASYPFELTRGSAA